MNEQGFMVEMSANDWIFLPEARALFASALCQMKDDERKAVIDYWKRYCKLVLGLFGEVVMPTLFTSSILYINICSNSFQQYLHPAILSLLVLK
jgi:hypothetical protein